MSEDRVTTLLVIEDNLGDVRLLREMFQEARARDSTMIEVRSMAEAERHLAEHEVDVILLDLGLPDAQGLAAVERAHAAATLVEDCAALAGQAGAELERRAKAAAVEPLPGQEPLL